MSTIQMVNGFDADLHWGCEPDNLPFLDESCPMNEIFLLNRAHWVRAALQHFAVWESKEHAIFLQMTPRVSLKGIESAGAYYRVARHFPVAERRRLVSIINAVGTSEGSAEERFDAFVRSVRKLANRFAQEFGNERRRLRPISGMSKLLWYRFPFHGFIYDSQVLAAVCKNGLTVRFDGMIDAFGGRPSDDREWDFMIAAAAYRTLVLPLHGLVAEVFKAHDLEPERAARLLDMVLWLEGDVDFSDGLIQRPSNSDIANAAGEEAFARSKEVMKRLLRGA